MRKGLCLLLLLAGCASKGDDGLSGSIALDDKSDNLDTGHRRLTWSVQDIVDLGANENASVKHGKMKVTDDGINVHVSGNWYRLPLGDLSTLDAAIETSGAYEGLVSNVAFLVFEVRAGERPRGFHEFVAVSTFGCDQLRGDRSPMYYTTVRMKRSSDEFKSSFFTSNILRNDYCIAGAPSETLPVAMDENTSLAFFPVVFSDPFFIRGDFEYDLTISTTQ